MAWDRPLTVSFLIRTSGAPCLLYKSMCDEGSARFQVPKDGTLSTQIKERTPNGPLTEAFYENQNQGKKVLKTWTPH